MASTVKLGNGQEFVSKADYDKLAAESAQMKSIIDAVTDLNAEPTYHEGGMGCGLEDRGIHDRYEAMRHGWDQAMERVYGEVIPCAEELDFKATDAAIAEFKARGVEELARTFNSKTIEGSSMVMVAKAFAANLRAGVKS